MINCVEMKAKIEKRIEERKTQQAGEIERWEAKRAGSKGDWLANHRHRWEAALREMAAALRDDEPITQDMLPKARRYRDDVEVWCEPSGRPGGEYQPPEAVTMLLAAMEMHDGEEISTSELARLGIGSDHMRNVTRFLSKGWG